MNPFGSRPSSPAYAVHKLTLGVGLALWLLGIITGNLVVVALGGVAFLVCGVAAIAGGKSVVTGIRLGGLRMTWSHDQLDAMDPHRRRMHAVVTGIVSISLGAFAIGLAVLKAQRHAQEERRAELERQRGAGVWRPDHPYLGPGYDSLAIRGGRICYAGSDYGIVDTKLGCTSSPELVHLGNLIVERLRLSGEHLLWASKTSAGVFSVGARLEERLRFGVERLPRELTGTPGWVAWDDGSGVVVRDLDSAESRRIESDLPAEGPIVLAALGGNLGFGPTSGCSFQVLEFASGQKECVVPGPARPLSADVAGDQIALALEDGQLLTLTGKERRAWGKVASPLAVSLVDRALFVVSRDGVYRLRAPGAAPEPLFLHSLDECATAGAFGELLAWEFGRDVRVIRRAATPLEPFELR